MLPSAGPPPTVRRSRSPSAGTRRGRRGRRPRAEPRPGLSGAAVDVYGPEATRALFRAGLVEQARAGSTSGGSSKAVPKAAAPDSTDNGSVATPRKRPPGARRTRPLRANWSVPTSVRTAPTGPPSVDALRAAGVAAGLDVVEVASAEPFPEVEATLVSRKAAGLHGGMSFTYRKPERSTDPGAALPGAKALVVGARGYLTDEPDPSAGPAGRIARYAWDDHYALLRSGLAAVSAALRADGWRTRVLVDDNALVDRAAAHRAGIGWWGKNANLLLPGVGSWYVLGSVVTDAPLTPSAAPVADGCGGCTRCLEGCPTGAIVAPGVVDARRCLSWLLQAEGAFPREHRVALGDRIYGCDDCQEVCPPNRRAPVSPPTGDERAWAPLLALLHDDDAVVLAWADRWYIPQTGGPLRPSQRPGRPRQLGRPARPGRRGRRCAATSAMRTGCSELTPSGRLAASDARIWSASRPPWPTTPTRWSSPSWPRPRPPDERPPMTHLFVTNDFPPKIGGIQTMLWELWRRLDPASFVVLTTPHADATAWDAEQPFRVVRTKQKVLLPTRGLRHQIEALAGEVGAAHVVLDPALPVGLLGPRLQGLHYGIVVHGAEVTVPGRLPLSKPLLGRVLRGAGLVLGAGGYPLAEATRAAGRALPSALGAPGSRHGSLRAPRRRRAGGGQDAASGSPSTRASS